MITLEIVVIISFIAAVLLFLIGRSLYLRHLRSRQEKRLNAMFASITHELLTPLTIISASVDHLRDVQPQYSEEYDLMEINIQRSVRLLQQILETAKANDGSLRLLVSQGDVMGYIRQTARSIIPLMAKQGVSFSIECSPQSMMGWIDTDKLDKIIFNLLSNAAKYTTGADGHVSLKARTNRNYDRIYIEVADNGCGIPKKRQKDLFKMFYDGDYRRFNTFGNGIGLALTKQLVFLHGGQIRYEGDEGKGSTFIVMLPINKEAFQPSQIDEKHKVDINIPESVISDFQTSHPYNMPPASPPDDAYRLLIVEDNVDLLHLMAHLLQSQYHVYTAENGTQALEIVHSQAVDLVVSDVMMPGIDGYELTSKIKSAPDTRHLPVILLTAKRMEEDKRRSLSVGADDYVTKPFKMGELRLRIDNIIENRRRQQQEFRSLSIDEARHLAANKSPESLFLDKALRCVHEHIADSDYDRNRFASDMGMSESSLYNKLRSVTGMSVTSFIRDIRLKEACRLMKTNKDQRVSDIAYAVGYKDPKYFATIFKKEFGMQPSEYMDNQNPGE